MREKLTCIKLLLSWSWWPRGIRHGTAAARLLALWIRIPPGTWVSVSCECCLRQADHSSWGVLPSVMEEHLKGGLGPLGLSTHVKTLTWTDMAQDKKKQGAVVKTVMNFRFRKIRGGNFVTSWKTMRFSRKNPAVCRRLVNLVSWSVTQCN